MRVEELTREKDDGIDIVEKGKPCLSLVIHHNIGHKAFGQIE
jgi:hypothetical protein